MDHANVLSMGVAIPGQDRFVWVNISRDAHLRLFDLFSGEPRSTRVVLNNTGVERVELFTLSHTHEFIAALGSQGTVKVWSTRDASQVSRPFFIPKAEILSLGAFMPGQDLKFSSNDQHLAVAVNDGIFQIPLTPVAGEMEDIRSRVDLLSIHQLDQAGSLERIDSERLRVHEQRIARDLQ